MDSLYIRIAYLIFNFQVKPAWRLLEQFVVASIQSTMITDSSATTRAMTTDAESPSEISALFDTIAYGKCKVNFE